MTDVDADAGNDALKAALERGSWRVSHNTSEIAGTKDVFLSVIGTAVAAKYGRSFTPSLYVRCYENKTAVLVEWGQFLGSGETRVEWRIDDTGPRSATWNISTDHQAVSLWSGGQAIPFARSLFDRKRLAIRVTQYSESSVTSTFDITGLRAASEPLRQACGWGA